MNAVLGAVRLTGALIFTSTAAFFAWLSMLVLRNLFDPAADNSNLAYFSIGAPLAVLAVMCLGLAWTAAQGERVRFAQIAAATLGFTFLALIALRLR